MTAETPIAEKDTEATTRNSRKQSLFFLAKFLVLVAILLIGYRYTINSSPNIRYLYTIATQTSFALNILGQSSEIEPRRLQYSREKIWEEMNELNIPHKREAKSANSEPPSAWEYWRVSAHREIQNGPGLLEHGPTIRFLARKGYTTQRVEAGRELRELEEAGASETQTEATKKKIELIDNTIREHSGDENAYRDLADRSFNFRVVPDCGAIPSMAIYLSAVLAFPVAWRKRVIGALSGIAALYTINICRLVALAFVGAYDTTSGKKWFTFIHEYVWQSIFLVFVVCVWLAWVELIVKPKQADES